MRAEAERLGLRVWLFGGTASSFAHYVKWDGLRKKGDQRFQADRFDYDYTNIYRSNQDLDIVVDGPPEKAAQLEKLVKKRFRYFQKTKKKWEIRFLKEAKGHKEPLLDNPSFLGQHTDSGSTGMIELTVPPDGRVVRDLKEWKSESPPFLEDIAEGGIRFYSSPTHGKTARAKKGLNPPIIAAIRYLTKAFQFELKVRDEDWARIKKIVEEIDPKRDTSNEYVEEWIEKNGKKLIQNAVNIEYAVKKLDELGLSDVSAAIEAFQKLAFTPEEIGRFEENCKGELEKL